MGKNWFCGICTPRPSDSGGDSDGADDDLFGRPNQNENERLMKDFARAGVDGGDGDINSGTKNNPRKSPNEGKSDKREIVEDTTSKVPSEATLEVAKVAKKKSGKKRNRGGGSERKKEHLRPDSDDGTRQKEKKRREKPRKSSKDNKDRRTSDQQKNQDQEEKTIQGQHLSSPEKKDKKKKKKTKKKKKKVEKGQEENTDNAVDEKNRSTEGKLEGKEIGSLNESLESVNDTSEQRKVKKSSTVSNDSCSSESIKLPAATSEDLLDSKTEDGNECSTIRNDNESYENSLSNFDDGIQSDSNNYLSNDNDDESLNPDEIIFENKSISDINHDNDSLDDSELFDIHTPNPRPKKQFLDAALTAKSLSDLNYVHSAQASKTARRKSLTDLKFDDDKSLEDDEVFELDQPIPRPKKQFLEAALMAKSLSDLNYVHSVLASNASKASRRKSLTDLKYDDDNNSLGDDEVFKLHPPSPRPKKQFLDAALAAKSISDLNFVYSAQAQEVTTSQDSNFNYSNDSLEDFDLFPLDEPIPRPKKQFLEAALTAKSLSDLNYVHTDPAPNASEASRRKSLTDLKYDDDNSLGDDEVFKLHPPSPRPKKQFLDAALAAKSLSDLNFVYSAQVPEVSTSSDFDGNCSHESLDDVQLFELDEPIPRPKKQFLDAALAAKSLSDLNFVYSAQVPEVSTSIDFDGNCSHESLDDVQLFEADEPIPRPKKQFLDAALAAKSLSDLNFVYSTQAPELTRIQDFDGNSSNDSLDDVELFELDEPSPRPKKQFLDAALTAKSISDLNFVYSAQVPELTPSQDINGNSSNDSLDDVELFELDEPSPRPKRQFLDAALTAKSISDLNYVFSAQVPEVTTTQDFSGDSSNDSLGELFELDEPILRPKKQFLEAALMAKSLSDLNYVHSVEEPKVSRRKSLTDLNDDDRSLGDDEVFELLPPIPRPKKQFLEAALMAKSLSDLRYMHLVSTTVSNSEDNESRENTSNIVPEHLLRLSQPNQFQTPDNHSIDDDDLFELVAEDEPKDRPILRAALEAKAQQDEGVVGIRNCDAPKHSSNDSQTEIVPEHLVVANQPTTAHAHDNYSIEVEDIFDRSSGEQNPQKPLLKAALEARAQREEEYAKSLSCRKAEHVMTESSDQHSSKNVPDHLAVAHQPPKALPTLDELSIDNDRLFDSPEPEGKNLLLMAALKAKEETHILQSPFSKSELEILKEGEHVCYDKDDKASDIFDETEGNDGGLESK